VSYTTLNMFCVDTVLKIEDYGGESSCFQVNAVITASVACYVM
jgi:hypothetical protein